MFSDQVCVVGELCVEEGEVIAHVVDLLGNSEGGGFAVEGGR